MGTLGSQTMLRLYRTPEMLGFQPATSSATSGAESALANATSQAESTNSNSSSSGGEGESTVATAAEASPLGMSPLPDVPVDHSVSGGNADRTDRVRPDLPKGETSDPFHELAGAPWHADVEEEVLEVLAASEPVQPRAVESAMFSMMQASSRR